MTSSGDSGVIAQMFQATSILQAANEWGKGVERYGINDVHSPGLAFAASIMNKYAGGTNSAAPGWAMVGERGMELVKFHGGEEVLSTEQSLAAIGAIPGAGYWQGTNASVPVADYASGGAASLKSALRDVEAKLDKLNKTTANVGGDVAQNLNSTGRSAGQRAVYGGR